MCTASHLGSIKSHAEALGPVQLLGKGRAGASLPENIKQRAPGTELCDDAGRLYAHAHEHDHVWVPHARHDGHLHGQTGGGLQCYGGAEAGRGRGRAGGGNMNISALWLSQTCHDGQLAGDGMLITHLADMLG